MFNLIMQNNNKSHGTQKVPWLTLICSGIMILLFLFKDQLLPLFYFDQQAILQGEVWRFFTGHFMHFTFEHLFWDLAAFMILGAVIELNDRRGFWLSLSLSCLGVSSWLLLGEQKWLTYCGLSGALNGMLVVAAVILFQQTERKIFLYVIAATIGKIIFEFATHQTVFTNLSSQAVPSAHAAGIMTGIIYILAFQIKNVIFARFFKKYKLN